MKIEVLVSTMHQTDTSLIDKMNLQTDAVIINQGDRNDYQEVEKQGNLFRVFSFCERGVGLSRNSALMRSKADICVLADDDMVFCDDYEARVEKAFSEHRDADVIIFNLDSNEPGGRENQKVKKIHLLNYMNYGAARIAFRRLSVQYPGISFNLHFGGGTEHRCGEDTLFLRQCLHQKLKVIAVPMTLATLVDDRPSTWFCGYDQKYFFDKGVVLSLAHPKLAKAFCLYLALRHKEYASDGFSQWDAYQQMCKGIRYIRKREYHV